MKYFRILLLLGAVSLAWAQIGGPGLTTLTSPSALWLYSAPTGSYTDLSGNSSVQGLLAQVNNANNGIPVQYTDGSYGTTTFNDYNYWGRQDNVAVPNMQSNGCGFTPATNSDGHLSIVNTSNRMEYEFWRFCADSNGCPTTCPTNQSPYSIGWIHGQSLNATNGADGGATAAGIIGIAGVILPGELDIDEPLHHALSIYVPESMMNPNICTETPANHTDGSVSGAIFCEGAKLRMDPSVNVDSLSASVAAKSIMKTMQLYGGVIVDQSGCSNCIGFYSALPDYPDIAGLDQMMNHLWIYYGS